jgi:sulfur carrier protein
VLVVVNGERKELPARTTLRELVEELTPGPQRVAVELNGLVVRRSDWPATQLHDGDRIEIVHFVGGG